MHCYFFFFFCISREIKHLKIEALLRKTGNVMFCLRDLQLSYCSCSEEQWVHLKFSDPPPAGVRFLAAADAA